MAGIPLDHLITVNELFFTTPFSFLNDPACPFSLQEADQLKENIKQMDWQVVKQIVARNKKFKLQLDKKAFHAAYELQRLIDQYSFLI